MKDIRVAAVICRSQAGSIQENLEKTIQWVHAAKSRHVELICFPELNVTGYSIRKNVLNYAEVVPGSVIEKLSEIASLEKIIILAGILEKSPDKKRVYASHLVAWPDKNWQIYRKLHIAPPEKDLFVSGNRIPIFDTGKVKFGIQLCYDAHFPELSTCMALKGVDMIFMPHASPRGTPKKKLDSWSRHLPARAYDNGVFVIACNQTGDNAEGLQFPGLAIIIGPDGNIMQKDISGKEGLLVADLKAKDLEGVREHRIRYFIPNRRDDLYDLK